MQELEIKIYSTPGCSGCRSLKIELEKSEYTNYIEDIDIIKDQKSLSFLREKGIMSVPTIGVFYNKNFNFITGVRPVEKVDKFIKDCINN